MIFIHFWQIHLIGKILKGKRSKNPDSAVKFSNFRLLILKEIEVKNDK